jgi:hypothetical protein
MLRTNVTDEERKAGQESVSVIHAPETFGEWVRCIADGSE